MAVRAQDIRLLSNTRFRRLLGSRVLGQTAQNAFLYALLILVVKETGSSVQSAFLVVSFTLPAIVLGIPAGAVADILPKRFILTAGYLSRAAVVAAMIVYRDEVAFIFLLAVLFSSVGQFFAPAESASVPALVRREQLAAANSLMVFTLILGQVAGMVVLAPLLFKLLGSISVLVVASGLFVAAGWTVAAIPIGRAAPETTGPSGGVMEAILAGFRILRTNRRAFLAVSYLSLSVALAKVLVVLVPHYTEDVLGISAEDTVFVAAPAAIGAGLGLLLAPPLARLIGSWRVVAMGLALFLLGLLGLGLIVYVRDFVQENWDIGFTLVEERAGVPSVVTMTMILAIPLGLAFSLVNVAARAVMNQEAPQEYQGRVFAVQMAVADFLSLLPLLIVGAVADLVGVRATLLASAISATAVALYLALPPRAGPPRVPAERAVRAG